MLIGADPRAEIIVPEVDQSDLYPNCLIVCMYVCLSKHFASSAIGIA